MSQSLSTTLLGRLRPPAAQALGATSGLEDYLRSLLEAARGAWPTLQLTDEAFLAYLGERLPGTAEAPAALNELHVEDLFLACACARGDGPALALFDRHFLSAVRGTVGRMDASNTLADEVKQELRQKLFVAAPGRAAKISEYSGKGSLMGWLRAVAMRAAINQTRGQKPRADESELLALPAVGRDPEVAFLQGQYREDFRAAFQAALASLSSRERNVLRMSAVDGLSIDEIGNVYRVHRATVARWLQHARTDLLQQTRRKLAERLSLGDSEADSLINHLRSQVDLSIHRLLRQAGGKSDPQGGPAPAE